MTSQWHHLQLRLRVVSISLLLSQGFCWVLFCQQRLSGVLSVGIGSVGSLATYGSCRDLEGSWGLSDFFLNNMERWGISCWHQIYEPRKSWKLLTAKGSLQNTMNTITLGEFFITSERHVSHHFRTQPENRASWLLTSAALWEVTRSKAMRALTKGTI